MHRRRLVQPAGDRLEVVDREHPRVLAAVPADHVERVPRIHVPGPAAAGPDQHLDVRALGQQRLVRAAQVAFAVRGVLEELAAHRQVALRGADVPGRLDGQQPDLLVRHDPVHHRRRDDHVVAGADLERAERRLHRRRAGLHVEALVADRVAVVGGRPVGDRVPDPHVVVGQQLPAAQDRVGRTGVQFVGAQMAWLQRVVRGLPAGRRLERLGGGDRGGWMAVVEQGRVGGETFLTHQLLCVQTTVRPAELCVTLTRNLPDPAVVRHRCLPPE
jgi:hypothetical protein